MYRLRSMVCYYGAHYQAFVRRPDSAAWQLFDDASVSDVDSWHHVRSKCERGHIQPAVLFFEAEEGGPPPPPAERRPCAASEQWRAAPGPPPEPWPRAAAASAPVGSSSHQRPVMVPPTSLSGAASYPASAQLPPTPASRAASFPAPTQLPPTPSQQHLGVSQPPPPAMHLPESQAWAASEGPGYQQDGTMGQPSAPADDLIGAVFPWEMSSPQQPGSMGAAPPPGSTPRPYLAHAAAPVQQGPTPVLRNEGPAAGPAPGMWCPSPAGSYAVALEFPRSLPYGVPLDLNSATARQSPVLTSMPAPALATPEWRPEAHLLGQRPQPQQPGRFAPRPPAPPGLPPSLYPGWSPRALPADLSRPPPLHGGSATSPQHQPGVPPPPPPRSSSSGGSGGSRSRGKR